MRLAVVGSRNCNDYDLVATTLAHYLDRYGKSLVIISGGAIGADKLAARFAKEHDLELIEYLPDWEKFGKAAGFKRNWLIWEEAEAGVAFWDGVSKGTAHSFRISKQQHKPLHVVEFTPEKMEYTT